MNSVHSSNSNESSMELSSMNYPNSHLNASNSNTSSEGGNTQNHSDFSMLSGVGKSQNSTTANAATTAAAAAAAAATASPAAPKPLATFTIKDNFEAHPSHKVEEGIFQHMNKLPPKKKDNLKQLGVRFTGQMTLNDKSIIVENFIKFCQVSAHIRSTYEFKIPYICMVILIIKILIWYFTYSNKRGVMNGRV